MIEHKFTEEDFTEDELMLLKMAFSLADNVIHTLRTDNYDVYLTNALYDLKHKLGIYDILQILWRQDILKCSCLLLLYTVCSK